MKKSSLFVLLAVVGLMVSCGGTSSEEPSSSEISSEIPSSSEAVADSLYFGLGNKAAYAVKSSGTYIQVDVTMGGFLFDKDGKVLTSYIDVMQVKIKGLTATTAGPSVDATKLNTGSDFKTKRELGDAYGMASTATKGEWYVQANAWQAFTVGKTAAAVAAANGTEALTATVTIHTNDYEYVLTEAWANRVEFSSFDTANLKVGVGMTSSHSNLKTTINTLASVFDADNKVVLAIVDVFQPAYLVTEVAPVGSEAATYTIAINATSVQTDTVNALIKSKLDLGDLYGMGSTATKGEWYVQAAAWQDFVVGKTAAEAAAANGTAALTATVTIHTIDFENCLTEAFNVKI